ncbi:HD-GYP domain-containing protein [Clostridium oceanicum]|uniref:HD domain-containing protein n=1 Tax=Clostridium oceanicum TaxID=1543 RepID=A0ABP3UGD7_9CLOT
MDIYMDNILRSISAALDLSEMSSINKDNNIIENITNINYSSHFFLHHSERTSYIAYSLAKAMNIEGSRLEYIYVSSLLHDIGAANFLSNTCSNELFIKGHCETGAKIVKSFPIFKNIGKIILYHHENWDGSGALNIKNSAIPLESQIIRMADIIELLYKENIPYYIQKEFITKWILEKKDKIFSPKLIKGFLKASSKDSFWLNIENTTYMSYILADISPVGNYKLDLNSLTNIAYIFSNIIDSKSKFTANHSIEISKLSYSLCKILNYDEKTCTKMKIAGLLHDTGKLAVPTSILDKDGPLNDSEFSIIKSHAYYTGVILKKIANLKDIGNWASNHHEKLNGSGYPLKLTGKDLSRESRILAVCDIYQALTEDRPYRKGLKNEEAFSILDKMVLEGLICSKSVKDLKYTLYKL